MKGRILVLVTGSSTVSTGFGTAPAGLNVFSLVEAIDPAIRAGWTIHYTSLHGSTPTCQDGCFHLLGEVDRDYYESYVEDNPNYLLPTDLASLTEEKLQPFVGLLIPDGLGCIDDMPNHTALKRLLQHFHHYKKPIGTLGFGIAGLLHEGYDTDWLFEGYDMTTHSDEYIAKLERWVLDDVLTFHLNDHIQTGGGHLIYGPPAKAFLVEDRELLTGHSAYSAAEFGRHFLKKVVHWLEHR